MVDSVVLLAVVAFGAVLAWQYRDTAIGCKRSSLPGPKGLPFIGNLLVFSSWTPRFYEHLIRLHEQYGDVFTVSLPGLRFIITNQIADIEHAQSNKAAFDQFVKGEKLQSGPMRDVLGTGIFASDGHQWLVQRKSASRIFSRRSFETLIQDNVVSHAKTLIDVLGQLADSGKTTALNRHFFAFTLDSFVAMAFGEELDSMRSARAPQFQACFDEAQEHIAWRAVTPLWSVVEKLNGSGRKHAANCAKIDEFAYSILEKREIEQQGSGESKENDLLALFASIRDEKGEPLTRKELRDAMLNLIIAGRDTTAQTLSYAFFWLMKNWDQHAGKIREEADRVLGKDSIAGYEQHKSLVYGQAVFLEACRLAPAVPKNIKQNYGGPSTFPSGFTVRGSEFVFWSDWVIARTGAHWGKDAAQFNPARWIAEDGSLKKFDQYHFHSFNAGPRLCLGQNLAIYEGTAALVAIVQAFDIAFAPGYLENTPLTTGIFDDPNPSPHYLFSLTLPMKGQMDVVLKRRKA